MRRPTRSSSRTRAPRSRGPSPSSPAAASGRRSSRSRRSSHSPRDRIGFIPTLVGLARSSGVSGYVGDGANTWPTVHTLDLSRLFAIAIENAPAGAQLYGAAEDDVTTREIAETIARHLGVPARSVSTDDAEAHFGGFAPIMALDFPPMTSRQTQQEFGWQPTQPSLLEDLDDGHYFATAASRPADPSA